MSIFNKLFIFIIYQDTSEAESYYIDSYEADDDDYNSADENNYDNPQFVNDEKFDHILDSAKENSGIKDAITTAYGKMNEMEVTIAAMNFKFIGGSGEQFNIFYIFLIILGLIWL